MVSSVDDYRVRIKGFLHYRLDLGEGMQTAVFFDQCSRKCRSFCTGNFLAEHAVGIDEAEKESYTADELIAYLMEEQKWCASRKLIIRFTGGEPLKDPWYCVHVAKAIKEAGMKVIFRTCGDILPQHYYVVQPYTDLFIFDMITMIPCDHKRLTGFSFQRALDCLYYLDSNRLPYRLRIRILPGVNDTSAQVFAAFCERLDNVMSVILDFSTSGMGKEQIRAYRDEFKKRGIILY